MAKKDEKKISYAPNMGLIAGEAQVAASEAGLTNIGSSFVGGAASIFAAFKQEEKAMENKMEVYSAAFPGLEQSYFMENSSNKQIVRNFLNDQRDEYVKLAEIYENTKDRTVMDKMKAIEFSIRNLDDQIKVFNTDKAEYRKAFDDGQLASGKVYEKEFFTNIYTDNSSFVITENGDISFNKGGKKNNSKLYKDHAGNWINRNNISETYFLETYSSSYALGEAGKSFNEKATYSSIYANLKATGNEGLQTIATTDLASDDTSRTFEEQWASGSLDESFYKERKIEDGTDWMFDNKNADELRGLISNYYTNVMKDGHTEGKKSYTEKDSVDELDFYSKGNGVKLYNNQILTGSSAESFYTAIRDGVTFEEKDPISGKNTEYSYQVVGGKGGWYENFEEGDTPESVQYIGSGADLASRFTTDQRFRNLQTTVEERVDLKGVTEAKETRLKGDYSTNIRSIDINTMDLDDNVVAGNLAAWLPPVRSKSNPKGYAFYVTQAIGDEWSFERGGGAMDKESVTLYQLAKKGEEGSFMGPGGYRIKPAVVNGKIVEIKTGGNLQRRRKAIADIDALFSMPEFKSLMLDKPRP